MYDNIINKYISKVTKDMGSKQRKEVACELETHILDSADALAAEKNVQIDETIIHEVINRMGSAEKIAAIYPKEKAFSDNILDILKVIGRFTVIFIIIAIIMNIITWAVQGIYIRDLYPKFGTFTIPIFILIAIYMIFLIIRLMAQFKILSKLFGKIKSHI